MYFVAYVILLAVLINAYICGVFLCYQFTSLIHENENENEGKVMKYFTKLINIILSLVWPAYILMVISEIILAYVFNYSYEYYVYVCENKEEGEVNEQT